MSETRRLRKQVAHWRARAERAEAEVQRLLQALRDAEECCGCPPAKRALRAYDNYEKENNKQ